MPPIAPISELRVNQETLFAHTGLDYFELIFTKQGDERQKLWVCLFSCLVTR